MWGLLPPSVSEEAFWESLQERSEQAAARRDALESISKTPLKGTNIFMDYELTEEQQMIVETARIDCADQN